LVLAPIETIVDVRAAPGRAPLIVETVSVERAIPPAVIVDITIVDPKSVEPVNVETVI
jgi:hypothetical protein